MAQQVELDGVGLHTGAPVRVTLRPSEGPVRIESRGASVAIRQLVVVSTDWATTVQGPAGEPRIRTVEHALAALGGMAIHDGLTLVVEGPEMPILDGGATAWCSAVLRLGLRPGRPLLRIAREAVFEVGQSRYDLHPCDGQTDVSVHVELDDPRLEPHARWAGDPADFVERIAPARTFARSRDLEPLLAAGLARHVDPSSVVVLTPDAVLCTGRAFSADEPARHKLLDLVGDMYLVGGPPWGRLHARRPGHASNARALRRALDEGVLVPVR